MGERDDGCLVAGGCDSGGYLMVHWARECTFMDNVDQTIKWVLGAQMSP